ncbi:hypothetical protein BDN67DRAFT_972384 [Paxillus ammoniavirescens]|nr:hypothetical protein BDN67DRAFT_972384 [Paxillus ammoniavirescens]
MSLDERLPENTESPEPPSPKTETHRRTSQKQPQGPAARSAQGPQRSVTNPHFTPVPMTGQSIQGQEFQTVPGSPLHVTSPSPLFPLSPPPPLFSPAPPYTHRNSFTGQYTMSSHPPFQSPPPQSYLYARANEFHPHSGLPLESGQFQRTPPTYIPLFQHHIQPYHRHHTTAEGSHPSYHHASHVPLPVPLAATSSSGTSHVGLYGGQQYPPPHYNPSNSFAFAHQYPPGPYQWYYPPGSSAPPFNEGIPVQFQHHFPINYPQPQNHQPVQGDAETRGAPSMERLGPLSPISASPSGNTDPPASVRKSVLPPAPSSPALNTHEQSVTAVPVDPPTSNERPNVRRPYHANPPAQRSEWVMWVGNVPGDATHDELWRFLKRPASPTPGNERGGVKEDGVTSVFLISRSNCAFVNFTSEEHLTRAIARFNGQQLRSQERRCLRLVCRARGKEDDLRAGVGAQRGAGVHTQYIRNLKRKGNELAEEEDRRSNSSGTSQASGPPSAPLGSSDEEAAKLLEGRRGVSKTTSRSHSSYASTNSSFLSHNFPKRFFILKSLTQYDLDLSVERGVWATQKHNEAILDQAYRTSKEVILIFGVNKSGEFYGYARMSGRILGGEHNVSWASRADSPLSSSSLSARQPRSHGTPAEPESPHSRGRPLTFFTPSESRLVEVSPLSLSPSQGTRGSNHSLSPSSLFHVEALERQSAPAAFGRQPEDMPLSRSSRSYSLKGWPSAPSSAKEAIFISSEGIELDKNAPVRAMRNKNRNVEDSSMSLQPVQEERQIGSGGEEEGGGIRQATPTKTRDQIRDEDRETAGWGETFKIEWLCTERLPFSRTRHLRNPWNHEREIKVSRDGTELEPGVGQLLVEEWLMLAADSEAGGGEAGGAGDFNTKSAAGRAVSGESKGNDEEIS